jgi:hypothetical protein
MNEDLLNQLKELRQKDKFADEEWEERGLNPSEAYVIERMDTALNTCIDDIIDHYSSGKRDNDLKTRLEIGLSKLSRTKFDTEEREFIVDYFYELSTIIGVNFNDSLNLWMYDFEI